MSVQGRHLTPYPTREDHHNFRHGYCGTETYAAWANMKNRCSRKNHPQWKDYGGRGITVCKRWLVFENFLADMGERPPGLTLERKNNDRGYYNRNCMWATRSQQQFNRRKRRN